MLFTSRGASPIGTGIFASDKNLLSAPPYKSAAVYGVVVKYFVRLDDCEAAAQVLFHVKGVFLVIVGEVFVVRVLRYVVLVREKRTHTP